MIIQKDKNAIRTVLQSKEWQIIERIAQEIISQIKEGSNLKDTEWETVKAVALEEGQIQGINRFVQELYKQAQDA